MCIYFPNIVQYYNAVMGIKERKEKHKDNLRKLIIDSAKEIALKEGWQSVTVRKIADSIDYSAPTLYEYFKDKDAILIEVAKEGFYSLADALKKAISKEQSIDNKIKAASMAYYRFSFTNRIHYEVMFSLQGVKCNLLKDDASLKESGQPIFELLKSKTVNIINLEEYFINWWCLIHGYITLTMTENLNRNRKEIEKLLGNSINRYLASL